MGWLHFLRYFQYIKKGRRNSFPSEKYIFAMKRYVEKTRRDSW
jgi:hypothetical protein